jgi:hypothetical protein
MGRMGREGREGKEFEASLLVTPRHPVAPGVPALHLARSRYTGIPVVDALSRDGLVG